MAYSKKTSRTLTQGMKVQTWPELMHNDGDSAAVVAEQRKRFLMELALALADVQHAWDDQSGTSSAPALRGHNVAYAVAKIRSSFSRDPQLLDEVNNWYKTVLSDPQHAKKSEAMQDDTEKLVGVGLLPNVHVPMIIWELMNHLTERLQWIPQGDAQLVQLVHDFISGTALRKQGFRQGDLWSCDAKSRNWLPSLWQSGRTRRKKFWI